MKPGEADEVYRTCGPDGFPDGFPDGVLNIDVCCRELFL